MFQFLGTILGVAVVTFLVYKFGLIAKGVFVLIVPIMFEEIFTIVKGHPGWNYFIFLLITAILIIVLDGFPLIRKALDCMLVSLTSTIAATLFVNEDHPSFFLGLLAAIVAIVAPRIFWELKKDEQVFVEDSRTEDYNIWTNTTHVTVYGDYKSVDFTRSLLDFGRALLPLQIIVASALNAFSVFIALALCIVYVSQAENMVWLNVMLSIATFIAFVVSAYVYYDRNHHKNRYSYKATSAE